MKRFAQKTANQPKKEQIFIKNGCRLTVITERLLRVEVQTSSVFCDLPTQAVVNRAFCEVECSFIKSGNLVTVKTNSCEFVFDLAHKKLKSIKLSDGRTVTNFRKGNLKGTGRTLDNTNGFCKLCDGVISKNGAAVLDDSYTLVLTESGHIEKRKYPETDLYYFAYGFDYNTAVRDYFNLTGFPPLIPRFALGNWWSRYKAYTQDEYETLIKRFENEKIPLTVATVDMDWHWVKVVEKFGEDAKKIYTKNNLMEKVYSIIFPGWTGYSWNTELFPDPDGFLSFLKNKGLKVTMNLHPAAGCCFFEDVYKEFCEFMNQDPSQKKPVRFDLSDDKFIEGYFKFLHHPHEEKGVDFWWIDWQQGKNSDVDGLDPLSALNRYHYIDNDSTNKRGLILSRFSGAGAHRYPIGFSGDTFMSWASLNYQPYFTATASNIGYTWWSHDIGGHTFGIRDDELYLRWVQLGVFSPIMRLHSTSNEFMGKEPWMYRPDVREYASDALRLRHRLIPYIYSANRQTAEEGIPLVRPMYYAYPHTEAAYNVPNQFFFGSDLIVCPITAKINRKIELAGTSCFIPEGRWTDIFTGRIYTGPCELKLFRDEKSIPVLAKEGAIIPMYTEDCGNSVKNPDKLQLTLFRGNGSYTLYEDDGETHNYLNGEYCKTQFTLSEEGNSLSFTVHRTEGDTAVLPEKRKYKLLFKDVVDAEKITVTVNKKKAPFSLEKSGGVIEIDTGAISPDSETVIRLENISVLKNQSRRELMTKLFAEIQGANDIKKHLFEKFAISGEKAFIPGSLADAVKEIEMLKQV